MTLFGRKVVVRFHNPTTRQVFASTPAEGIKAKTEAFEIPVTIDFVGVIEGMVSVDLYGSPWLMIRDSQKQLHVVKDFQELVVLEEGK